MVFFFQAEDGIRDVAVTGVQTCALPIWVLASQTPKEQRPSSVSPRASTQHAPIFGRSSAMRAQGRAAADVQSRVDRSEERRVGKGCRSRWAPDP